MFLLRRLIGIPNPFSQREADPLTGPPARSLAPPAACLAERATDALLSFVAFVAHAEAWLAAPFW